MANSDAGTRSGKAGGGQYQVFLNFHGQDTRDGFTSFLHRDLRNNGIHAFIDNEGLRVGEEIGGALLRAIDDSQIYIPIFSENYASSKWCLRELKRMVDNKSESKEEKILPIFYYVKPDDVDLKTKLYREAIGKLKDEHENKQREKFPHEVESWKGESWEEALKKVDKIKGWKLQKGESEAKLVDSVVEKVLQKLKRKYKSVANDLVGLDGQVKEVLKLLNVDCSDEVRLLRLYGMGGIGKTTLAKVVYNELFSSFGKCCAFLDNIRETLDKEGLVWLQKKLLREIASSSSAEIISGVDHGRERIQETLGGKEVLIVLDDVDKKEQIENLIGQSRLHPGTRIIITTRNKGLLKIIEQRMARKMKEMNSDHAVQILPHEMKELDFDHALQLFQRHAFLEGSSAAKDFDRLSIDIVKTTGGLPLALEVIGSFLFRKPKDKWDNTFSLLKKMPHEDVQKKLMISYDALNNYQREIFLDVACFFINEDMMNANYMWEDCGFNSKWEIDFLVDMSLIKIKDDNKFWMHDQLRDLGQQIVRHQSHTYRRKCSRLWTSEDVLNLVKTEESKEDVDALDLRGRSSHILISHEEIRRFKSLRFLRLSNGTLQGDYIVHLPELRWISWHSPSPDFSVASVHSNNLVVLELFDNHFTDDSKVWDLIKMATKLKSLALAYCHCLTRTPDLSGCLTLERLTFDYCRMLKEIGSSIAKLTCLLDLNITNCGLVEHVPDEIRGLVKLEHFSLKNSYKVSGLPTFIDGLTSLRKLDLSYTQISSLPDSIGKLQCLSYLNLRGSRVTEIPDEIGGLVEVQHLCLADIMIKQLPDSIGELKSLCTLDLSRFECRGLSSNQWKLPKTIGKLEKLEILYLGQLNELVGEIPDEIGDLSSLRVLHLCNTRISRVSEKINMLSHLSTLNLNSCHEIIKLPELPTSLVYLEIASCSLQVVPNLSKLTNLVELVLSDGSKDHDSSNLKHKCDLTWIGSLSKLKKLILCLFNIAVPPTELGLLSLLEELSLYKLDLQPLEQLPCSLLSLELDNFSSTRSDHFSRLQEIQRDGFSQLQHLVLERCDLRSLSIPSSLIQLRVVDCPNLIEIQFLGLSASLALLSIIYCQSIERIVLCGEGGSLGVLDQSESSSSELTYCSPGVLLLRNASKKLIELELRSCENLLEIQVIGTLLSLQVIDIQSCDAMEKFTGTSNLKNLDSLAIYMCPKLQVLEGLDKLEFLTELDVYECPSLETLFDISNSKIPDECRILVRHCGESLISSPGGIPFKRYKEMAQQGAPQPETNKEEAEMEGDAEEPDIELQLQVHPSTSSQYLESPASSTTLAAPDDSILPSKALLELLPSPNEPEGPANEAINHSDNLDEDRESLAQLIPQLRKRKRTSPGSPKKQLKTLPDVSVSTTYALLRKSFAIDTPTVHVPLKETPADNVPAMPTSSTELPVAINDVVSSNPIICSPSLPEHDDPNFLALVVYSKPILITSDNAHAEVPTASTPISTAQASSSSPACPVSTVLAIGTSPLASQTEPQVDISSQIEPQSSPTSALQALNKAKLILGVNPYDWTLGRIPNSINRDKMKIELSKFLDLSTGGICGILLDQETFCRLEVLSSQLGDESNEISAVLPRELREKFQKFFEDYHGIFDKYRYHRAQVQKLTLSEDNNAGSSAALTEFSQSVLECTKSLETIMGEITKLDEEEARLMKALQDVRQKREIKLGQQTEVEAKLNFQVLMLQDLEKEHLRREMQHRIHKDEHLSQMNNLNLRICHLRHDVKSFLYPKK